MNEESKEKLKLFQKIYDESLNIVFFGGAGVSTESGIPDFRSVDGLYYQQWKFPPEQILSHTFFEKDTKEFINISFKNILPNLVLYKKSNPLFGLFFINVSPRI